MNTNVTNGAILSTNRVVRCGGMTLVMVGAALWAAEA
jgi:hypothetical protein